MIDDKNSLLRWAEYTKKGIVCQEGKTTKEKTRRYEEKVYPEVADNDYWKFGIPI
jgi:hypothetical protein